jgi:hypothetical protein
VRRLPPVRRHTTDLGNPIVAICHMLGVLVTFRLEIPGDTRADSCRLEVLDGVARGRVRQLQRVFTSFPTGARNGPPSRRLGRVTTLLFEASELAGRGCGCSCSPLRSSNAKTDLIPETL